MKELNNSTRDIARELARKYSTMTHDELDILESVLVPMKFAKGEIILKEGDVCEHIYYVERGLTRQFYFKNGKELTEHIGVEHPLTCNWKHSNLRSSMPCLSIGWKRWRCTT